MTKKRLATGIHIKHCCEFINNCYEALQTESKKNHEPIKTMDAWANEYPQIFEAHFKIFSSHISNHYFTSEQLRHELSKETWLWAQTFLKQHGYLHLAAIDENIANKSSHTCINLTPYQALETSGARDILTFSIGNDHFIGIAQLAKDMHGHDADMNGGDGAAGSLIYRWHHTEKYYEKFQHLNTEGAESIDVITFNQHTYLVIAQIRSGAHPEYNYHSHSLIYRWDSGKFIHHQSLPCFAAKWSGFQVVDNHLYLVISESVSPPNQPQDHALHSSIYRLEKGEFEKIQHIPSQWGYSGHFFHDGHHHYLALGDHMSDNVIYQFLEGKWHPTCHIEASMGGRDFLFIEQNNQQYLIHANLLTGITVYPWTKGEIGEQSQYIACAGARKLAHFVWENKQYVVVACFITGDRSSPHISQTSQLYCLEEGVLKLDRSFPCSGSPHAHAHTIDDELYLFVANSLSPQARFRTDSHIYRLTP